MLSITRAGADLLHVPATSLGRRWPAEVCVCARVHISAISRRVGVPHSLQPCTLKDICSCYGCLPLCRLLLLRQRLCSLTSLFNFAHSWAGLRLHTHTHTLAHAHARAPTCSLMRAADYLNAATSEVETVSECYEHIFIAVEKFAHFCFNIILILCIVPEATPVILLLSDTSNVCLALQLSMCACMRKRASARGRVFVHARA